MKTELTPWQDVIKRDPVSPKAEAVREFREELQRQLYPECLDEEGIASFADGLVWSRNPDKAKQMKLHLGECAICRYKVTELLRYLSPGCRVRYWIKNRSLLLSSPLVVPAWRASVAAAVAVLLMAATGFWGYRSGLTSAVPRVEHGAERGAPSGAANWGGDLSAEALLVHLLPPKVGNAESASKIIVTLRSTLEGLEKRGEDDPILRQKLIIYLGNQLSFSKDPAERRAVEEEIRAQQRRIIPFLQQQLGEASR